jgi:CheY-like chemotaxis protein
LKSALVVEDEPFLRLVAEDAFRSLGFDASGAADGVMAVDMTKAITDLTILFTDVNLGAGPNGWEVADLARRLHPNVAVIYTSGQAGADEHSRLGVTGSFLLPKPYSTDGLASAVRDIFKDTE